MRDRVRLLARTSAVLLSAGLAAGCATQVATTATMVPPPATSAIAQGPSIPRPQRVLVQDFSVNPDAITLDRAIGLRLQRQSSGENPVVAQSQLATQVQEAISSTLVDEFQKMNVPVEYTDPGMTPTPGDLLVRGEITRIDQGNRTRRLTVGFGAGKSEVNAAAAIYYVQPDGQTQLLQSYEGSSNSGRKPGMAASAGMAVQQASMVPAALGVATSAHSEKKKVGVAGEGQRVAQHLSRSIGEYFARQGWIPDSAVPAWSPR